MGRVLSIWNASLLGRCFTAICLWFGRQWKESRIVRAFVAPMSGARTGSVFYKGGQWLLERLRRLYAVLRLDRLLEGSIFLQSFFWCAVTIVCAPLLPTMAVLALAAVGYVSMGLQTFRSRDLALTYSPVNRFVLLYALVYLGAVITSVSPRGSLTHGLLSAFFVLFALVVIRCLSTWARVERLVTLMILVGAAVSLIGIGQYFLGSESTSSWLDSDMFDDISARVYATLQNPNVLAEYFLLVIPLGVAALCSAKNARRRVLLLIACALMCLCMVLTFSRGGWLGLLLALAIFALLLNPRLIIAVPFMLLIFYFLMPSSVVTRFTSIGNLRDSSTSYRVSIWMGTINMLKDYWLCGIGPGTAAFNQIYPAYSYNTASAQHAHNLFLQLLCDGGVCVFGAFLAVLFVFCRCVCGAISRCRPGRDKYYLAASLAAVAGFMVQSMTDYTFYNYRVTLLFWVVIGLGASVARLSEAKSEEEGARLCP